MVKHFQKKHIFWPYVLTMNWIGGRLSKEYFDEYIIPNQELLVTSKEEMIFQIYPVLGW